MTSENNIFFKQRHPKDMKSSANNIYFLCTDLPFLITIRFCSLASRSACFDPDEWIIVFSVEICDFRWPMNEDRPQSCEASRWTIFWVCAVLWKSERDWEWECEGDKGFAVCREVITKYSTKTVRQIWCKCSYVVSTWCFPFAGWKRDSQMPGITKILFWLRSYRKLE